MMSSIIPRPAATRGFENVRWYSATRLRSSASGSSALSISLRFSTRTAPSAPITAISAVGQAQARSAPIALAHIARKAPPYALRITTVSFGTVAAA